ncbi:MAG TPA: class I adenylate-forming enzyme family protein [Acidimicrobiales bacterium]
MSAPPLPPITETLDAVLARDPDRVAVVGPSRSLTYAELDATADAAAAALRELGVGPQDRVAACLPNDVDIVVAFHGAMRLGAVWVGVNAALAPPEKEALLAASAPTVFLADPATAAAHGSAGSPMPGGVPWRTVAVDPGDDDAEWGAALAAAAGAGRLPPPDPHAPAGLAFTSGTTGQPKGIVHSQHNLVVPARALVASRGYDETLRKGDCLPLTILNLQVLTTLLTTAAGGCCVLTDRRDARGVAEWLAREQVTVWNGVPALLYSMVHDPDLDPGLLGSLREVWTGGAACPEDLFQAFQEKFGVPLRQTYGLTEAPTVVSIDPVDGEHVPGASGVPLPHLRVGVRDDELVVRAADDGPWRGVYRPMLGYWRDGRVEPYGRDDLPTGDVGTVDDRGYLHVRERKSLVINRGGANVYPAEVERVLDAAPGVRASAVLGLADDRLGQRVVAAVELEPGAATPPEELRDHCRQRLARYKVPDRIAVVEALPRNAMGKVQRAALADRFAGPDGA